MPTDARARFVILRHELPPDQPRASHWDFMLERGEVLRTWALAAEPAPAVAVEAQALADHRPHYLDYEGPVAGNRGQVSRWDAGHYRLLRDEPDCVEVRLEGKRLRGRVTLSRDAAGGQRWTFSLLAEPTSI
jgi:hypothetical protein